MDNSALLERDREGIVSSPAWKTNVSERNLPFADSSQHTMYYLRPHMRFPRVKDDSGGGGDDDDDDNAAAPRHAGEEGGVHSGFWRG